MAFHRFSPSTHHGMQTSYVHNLCNTYGPISLSTVFLQSPMAEAVRKQDMEMVKMLTEQGHEHAGIVECAIMQGSLEFLHHYMRVFGKRFNIHMHAKPILPLQAVAAAGQTQAAAWLLKHKAMVDGVGEVCTKTPLCIAVQARIFMKAKLSKDDALFFSFRSAKICLQLKNA